VKVLASLIVLVLAMMLLFWNLYTCKDEKGIVIELPVLIDDVPEDIDNRITYKCGCNCIVCKKEGFDCFELTE